MIIYALLLDMNNLVFRYCDANMTLARFFNFNVIVLMEALLNPCQILEFNLGLVPNLPKLFVWHFRLYNSFKRGNFIGSEKFIKLENDLSPFSYFSLFSSNKIGRE